MLSLLEENTSEVNADAVMERLGVSRSYASKLLHELTVKGWLHRRAPSRYRVVPPEWGPEALPDVDVRAAAVERAPDGYLGLASAASLHGLTTQYRRTLWVLLPRRKRGGRIGETPVEFIQIKPGHVFGTERRSVLGETIIVSDPEKTALDCLEYGIGRFDFSELTAIVLAAARRKNWERLTDYVRRFNSGPMTRRLGILLLLAKVDMPEEFAKVLDEHAVPKSSIRLNPAHAANSNDRIDSRFGVRLNVDPAQLFRI